MGAFVCKQALGAEMERNAEERPHGEVGDEVIRDINHTMENILSSIADTISKSRERHELISDLQNRSKSLACKIVHIKDVSTRKKRMFRRRSWILHAKVLGALLLAVLLVFVCIQAKRAAERPKQPSERSGRASRATG